MVHRTDGVGTLGSKTLMVLKSKVPSRATSNEQLARHPKVSPRLSGHVRTKKSAQNAALRSNCSSDFDVLRWNHPLDSENGMREGEE